MKKKLVASLAAAMVLSVAGTSFAASNPFVDLPAKHWAYESVTKLAQAGIVDGYGDGTFRGDKNMSRYEMAQIVAKAMARSDKADAAQKAAIDKLAVEFASELEGLNVRVTKIQNKVDKFDISGVARVRYDHIDYKDFDASKVGNQNINLDVFYSYKVNDEWSVKGESEFNRNLKKIDGNGNNNQFEQLYVTGPVAGTTIKVGKYAYLPTYGLVFDDKVSGAQVSFGNEVKTTLNVGKIETQGFVDAKYAAVDFVYAYSKDTNIKANYQKISNATFKSTLGVSFPSFNPVAGPTASDVSAKFYEVGFDTKFATDYTFTAAYAKSDYADLNKAYLAQVQYKAADVNVVGSSDVYVAYRKFQPYASIAATGDWLNYNDTYGLGFKGVRIGYDYVPAKNIKFGTWYQTGKTAVDLANNKVNTFRAQVELSF